MPKEAARVYLKVVNIQAKKIHDLILDDLIDLGVSLRFPNIIDHYTKSIALDQYISIWDNSLSNKNKSKYAFNQNPYVWEITVDILKGGII